MPTARVECQFYLISQFPADNRNAQYVGVQYTVEPLLTDPPRSGQPPSNGHTQKHRLILACY